MAHLRPNRIAFSFPSGTFDMGRMCAPLWEVDSNMGSAHVQLDARWEVLLPALKKLGVLMACAPSGPATVAVALDCARFEAVPNSADWVCLESGVELCPAHLGGLIVAIEELEGGQETVSFQFFDRYGDGCFKLLATNRTDVNSLEALVSLHAVQSRPCYFGSPQQPPSWSEALPETWAVRSLWDGLRRTLPESSFPGLEGVSRRRALASVGEDLAWKLRQSGLSSLLRVMTLADAPLGVGLRNHAVFLPAGMYPSHWSDCACGTTFFSSCAQLTLRHLNHGIEAWATRFLVKDQEVMCLEIYDEVGNFSAGIGLRPEATRIQREQWNAWLQRLRLEA